MQRIIAAVTVLAAVGIVSAFAAGQLVPSHQAGAAPSAQQVREQNLDASGFIRTHEQGTANVNVTNGSLPVAGTVNVGNLPAVQNVNVVSEPASPIVDKVFTFATNATGDQNGAFVSAALDTTGCRKLEVFLNFGQSNVDAYNLLVWESTDGVNRLLLTSKANFQILDNRTASWGSNTIANRIIVEVRNLTSGILQEGVLHCVSE
jgi:hypothetical protein